MLVNINGYKTQLTKEELESYLYKFPEYKKTYYIISK